MAERAYEIHVRGDVDPSVLRELPDVGTAQAQVRTVLFGRNLDQAGLHGLLNRLEMLGLDLVEVRLVPPDVNKREARP